MDKGVDLFEQFLHLKNTIYNYVQYLVFQNVIDKGNSDKYVIL